MMASMQVQARDPELHRWMFGMKIQWILRLQRSSSWASCTKAEGRLAGSIPHSSVAILAQVRHKQASMMKQCGG